MAEFGVSVPWGKPLSSATTPLRGDAAQSRVVAEPKVPAQCPLLARSASLKCVNWPGNNVFLSPSTAYPQGVGPVQCFDFSTSRDDVEHGKLDLEIYFLLARELEMQPEDCLVIEDWPADVKAALVAGMNVVAISTRVDCFHLSILWSTPSCSQLWLPMILLTINVTRRRDDSYGFHLLYSIAL
jgi:hypothetical protein